MSTAFLTHGLESGTTVLPLNFSGQISAQQKATAKIIRWFEETLNQGKPDHKEYSQRFLSAMNLQLFGYLGGVTLLQDAERPSPFRDHLEASKTLFRKDLKNMAQRVAGWTICGQEIFIPGSESFQVGGESAEFFEALQTAQKHLFAPSTRGMEKFALDRLSQFFGTFPGEIWGGVKVDQGNRSFWQPEETANLVRKSLEDENTLYRVIRLLEATHEKQDLRIADTGFRSSSRGTALDLGWVDYIRGPSWDQEGLRLSLRGTSRDVSHLKVERIYAADNYNDLIPPDKYAAFENFIEINALELGRAVPFRLTPKFWILEGPVTQRRQVYPDPLILLEFEEFPRTFLPIEAWLPSAKPEVRRMRPFQSNRFDPRLIQKPLDPGWTLKIGPYY